MVAFLAILAAIGIPIVLAALIAFFEEIVKALKELDPTQLLKGK